MKMPREPDVHGLNNNALQDGADLVLSLGPNCKNAFNLRSYFQFDRAYPFDWWIAPAPSVIAMLDPDFELSIERDDLVITERNDPRFRQWTGDTNTVFNKKLNVLQHHDFTRSKDSSLISQILDAEVENLNSKYRALFKRMREAVENARRPIAFVNGVVPGWVPNDLEITPRWFIESVRERLGQKVFVVVVEIGPEHYEQMDGGIRIGCPDTGQRDNLPPALMFAEPLHAFRSAYRRIGLAPQVSTASAEDNGYISPDSPEWSFGWYKKLPKGLV